MCAGSRGWPMIGNLPDSHPRLGRPSKVYPYRDVSGETVAAVYRFEPVETGKTGNTGVDRSTPVKPAYTSSHGTAGDQSRPVDTGLEGGMPTYFDKTGKKEIRPYCLTAGDWVRPARPLLYELDTIAADRSRPVILVEGEKCADALLCLGLLATTSMGGSNAAKYTDWSPIKGRQVIIWPDNDAPGVKYAHAVAELCLKAGAGYVGIVPISATSIRKALDSAKALLAVASSNSAFSTQSTRSTQCTRSARSTFSAKSALSTPNTPPFAPKALVETTIDTLPTGWDVADAIREGWQSAQIQALLDQSEHFSTKSAPSAPSAFNTHPTSTISAQGANDNWPAPGMSFLIEEIAPPAFPLEIFPPLLAEWLIQTAISKSAPVDYVAAPLLTGAASLIGTARRVMPWSGWSEPAILWTTLVGSPSAGKSPAMDPVLSVLAKLEGDSLEDHVEALRIYETDKLEAELAKERWVQNAKSAGEERFATPVMPASAVLPEMPMRKRLLIKDATSEALLAALKGQPKGFLTVRDELAGWFAAMDRYSASKGGDRALWLEAYGGRPYTLDRVKNGGEPFYIPSLAISVLGGIQPDRLQSRLLKGDDDGLSARFLYIYPNLAPRHRPKHLADDRIIKNFTYKLDALAPDMDENQTPCSRILPLSTIAADRFERWWQQLLTTAPENGRMSGWWGKAQGLCLRIALVLEYLEWAVSPDEMEPTELSVRTIENAINFIEDYAGPMAKRAHGVARANGYSAITLTLARHIQENGFTEISARDLQRGGPMRNLTAKEIKTACFELIGLNWLQAAPVQRGEGMGKNQGRFLVNPALHE